MKYPTSCRAAAMRMYRRKVPVVKICEALQVSADTVRRWRKAARVPARAPGGPRLYSEATRRHAMRLYRKSVPSEQIADIVGATRAIVDHWALQGGVKRVRPIDRHVHSAAARKMAVDMCRKGRSALAVSRIFDLNKTTIHRWAAAAGVKLHVNEKIESGPVVEAYAIHGTLTLTAKALGIGVIGVRRALARAKESA